MLDQLRALIAQQGQQAVVDNPAVPNDQNEAVLGEAEHSIFNSLQNMAQSNPAQLQQLIQTSGDPGAGNGGVNDVVNNFAGNMSQKLGINSGTAKTIAASLIPIVLGKLFNKAKDPNDSSISMPDILGSLTGGNGGGMMGNLSSIGAKLGLDKDGDGDVDMKDVGSMLGK